MAPTSGNESVQALERDRAFGEGRPGGFRLTEAQRQMWFDETILPNLVDAAETGVERPVAILIGGQPGSGKSILVAQAARELARVAPPAKVVGDEFRESHPHYRVLSLQDDRTAAHETNTDVNDIVPRALRWAREHRANLVLETTLRNSDAVVGTFTEFRDGGYMTTLWVLAVAPEVSELGTLHRYWGVKFGSAERWGRFVERRFHDQCVRNVPRSVERVEAELPAVDVVVWRRDLSVVWERANTYGHPSAADAIRAERARPLTDLEVDLAMVHADVVRHWMAELGAPPADHARLEDLVRRVDDLAARTARKERQ